MTKTALEAYLTNRIQTYEPDVTGVIVNREDPSLKGYSWDVSRIDGPLSESMLDKVERAVIFPLQRKIDLIDE
ncbi:hypothetical protein ACFPL7_15920 [Dongia soli]|uniref:Uncharacterized protein n=1 Tax=Dongia soli TaxID=600628 RepID=A0ABU5EBT2_9PROT|nr:hypothetical protein [Dongia soli]MDY0883616.1 hypothetical protein [Dongia soli]